MKPHRYEQSIAGRTYVIEVSAVSASRWRAQMARLPGMPTSLMPFYGSTPEEAAQGLTAWLSLVLAPPPLVAPGTTPAGTRSADRRAGIEVAEVAGPTRSAG